MAADLKFQASVAGFEKVEQSLKTTSSELGKTAIAANKLDSSLQKIGKQSGQSIFNLTEKLRDLQSAVFTEKDRGKIAAYNKEIVNTEKQLKALQTTGVNSMGALGNGAGKAFGVLRNLAYLLPGIGIAGLLGFAVDPIAKYISKLLDAKTALNDVQKAATAYNEVLGEGKSNYVKAVTEVENLRIAFRQAEAGIITQDEALKLYNDTIGKTTGKVNNLRDAEIALNKNAEAYIRFTLLKAVANKALEKSAEKMFEQLAEARKEFVPSKTNTTDIFGVKLDPKFLKEREDAERRAFTQAKMRRAADANDQSLTFAKIREDALRQAEELGQAFNFDFNGITEEDAAKSKRAVETINDVIAKLRREIEFLNSKEIAFNTNETKAKLSAYFSTIEKLIKDFKVDPRGTIVSKLFGEAADIKIINFLKTVKDTAASQPPVEIPFSFKNTDQMVGAQNAASQSIPLPTYNLSDLQVKEAETYLLGQGLSKAFVSGFITLPGLFQFRDKVMADLDALKQEAAAAMQSVAFNSITAIGQALGDLATNSGKGAEAIFGPLVSQVADFLILLGKAAVKASAVGIALKKLQINPQLGLIAGIAAIALGSILKSQMPGYAVGTRYAEGGLSVVGERGKELINLPRGASVTPAAQTAAQLNGREVYIPEMRIRGADIYVSYNRAAQTMGRNG